MSVVQGAAGRGGTFRVSAVAAVVMLLVAALASAAPARQKFRIGWEDVRDTTGIAAHLATSPTWEFVLVKFPSAEALYEALRDGKVDGALLGAINYVRARHAFGAWPLVADGETMKSIVVVRADSPIARLEDLAGKRLGFGHPESTTSYLLPMLLLTKAKVGKEKLGGTFFLGNHRAVADAVLSGKVDAGGFHPGVLADFPPGTFKTIATSPEVPGPPLVLRKEADPKGVAELKRLLLAWRPPAGTANALFGRGAAPVTDGDYAEVRLLCRLVLGEDYR